MEERSTSTRGDATGIVKKYSMVIKLFISILLYCILCN